MALIVRMTRAIALTLCLAGCGPGASSRNQDLDSVKRVHANFLAATSAKNTAAMKAAYAIGAVMVLPGLRPMRGIDAISADYKNIAADPVATFMATTDSVVMSAGGDLAFAEGVYRVRYTNPTSKAVERARDYYILVYSKQPD